MDIMASIKEGKYKETIPLINSLIEKEEDQSDYYYYLSLCHYFIRNYDDAYVCIKKALNLNPNNLAYQLLLAQTLSALNRLDEACNIAKDLFFREPSRDVYNVLEEICVKSNSEAELKVFVDQVSLIYPDNNLNLRPHSTFQVPKPHIPPILFCSMPKSGSIYITSRLASALQVPIVQLTTVGRFDDVVPSWVDKFAKGGVIAQEHLRYNDADMEILKSKGIKKIIVHFRDPRSAAISMMHHLDKNHAQLNVRYIAEKWLGKDHFKKNQQSKIDNILNTLFSDYVNWLEGWMINKQSKDFEVLFSSYDLLHTNECKVFNDILHFYDIPLNALDFPEADVVSKAHHRKGILNEWRDLLTSEQQSFAIRKMKNLNQYFDWMIN